MTCLAAIGIGHGHGASVAADDFPKRRPGLWEVRVAGADAVGMPPARFCVGDQTDTAEMHLDRAVGTRGSCVLGAFEAAGDAWVAESTCTEGRNTVTKVSVATGDFQTEYRIDTLVKQEMRGSSRREDREAVVAKWVGPCGPEQRPGDLVIPGMGTLNMDDGSFEAEPKPPAPTPARKPAAPRKPAPQR
jgi:hypothetical protein